MSVGGGEGRGVGRSVAVGSVRSLLRLRRCCQSTGSSDDVPRQTVQVPRITRVYRAIRKVSLMALLLITRTMIHPAICRRLKLRMSDAAQQRKSLARISLKHVMSSLPKFRTSPAVVSCTHRWIPILIIKSPELRSDADDKDGITWACVQAQSS